MRVFFGVLFILLLLLSDFYTLKAFNTALPQIYLKYSKIFILLFWTLKIAIWTLLIISFINESFSDFRNRIIIGFFSIYFGQFIIFIFSFIDEIRRGIYYLADLINSGKSNPAQTNLASISRSEFLAKTGIGLGSLALITVSSQSSKNLYDYQIRKVNLVLPNLPSEFEGIQIVQISDIHSGSFYNPKAVSAGIDKILQLKPEIIFFTGDLVNARVEEMKDYQDIFSKLKAPLGVYSVLGNHDYGEYTQFNSPEEKKLNHQYLIEVHKVMGYDLLNNENRKIKIGNQEIAILGVENWSAHSQFPKHGRLDLAMKGVEDSPIKFLLSHDPSHWKAQIIPSFPAVDVTFSGHTHGMQMGVRLPNFQWSPIQYLYPEWAGLYKNNQQQLYVNVGYGFIGFPGRIGMNPEITLFTLTKRATTNQNLLG